MPTRPRRATQAVRDLLAQRSKAVTSGDRAQFLATVDPSDAAFYAKQSTLVDRLDALQFADWSYELAGDGPGFSPTGPASCRIAR